MFFPDAEIDMVKALKKSGVTVVTVMLMNCIYVISDIVANRDAVLLVFCPGTTLGTDAVPEALFGKNVISGRTLFQIPVSKDLTLD